MVHKLFLLLAILSLLLLPAGVAQATPSTPISGRFFPTGPGTLETRMAGGNAIMTGVVPFAYEGPLVGTSTEDTRIVFHADGTFEFQIIDVCECTLDNKAGTLVSRIVGTGLAPNYSGNWTVLSASGDLAGLHLTAKFEGSLGTGGTYNGAYHFDP